MVLKGIRRIRGGSLEEEANIQWQWHMRDEP